MHNGVGALVTVLSGYKPELTSEQVKNLLDLIRHAGEFRNYAKATHGIAPIPKNYLGFYCDIHIHIFGRSRGLPADLCAVYQPHPTFQAYIGKWGRNLIGFDCHDLNVPMFIGVVYLVKQPKGAIRLPIPSVVRLQAAEQCDMPPFQVHDSGTVPSHFVSKRFGQQLPTGLGNGAVEIDGEASAVPFAVMSRLQSSGRIGGKFADQVVEGGAQVMGNLSDDNRPSKKALFDIRNLDFDPQDVLSAVTVELGTDNSIGLLRRDEVSNFVFDSLDLCFSPSNLFVTASKRM